MLLAQELNLAVHLGLGEEVEDGLRVLLYIRCQAGLVGGLQGHHHLGIGVHVAGKLELGLGVDLLDVDLDDVAHDAEHVAVEGAGVDTRDAERTLRLGKTRHVGVEHVVYGTAQGALPLIVGHHHEHLVGQTAGIGHEQALLL